MHFRALLGLTALVSLTVLPHHPLAAEKLPSNSGALPFQACIDRFQSQARDLGLGSERVQASLAQLSYQPRVIELDRRQPEFTTTFTDYFNRRVTDQRVADGRRLIDEHKGLLKRISEQYQVPPAYLVAFWGLETNFGRYFGKMPLLDSLATLACDTRRSDYFTKELMEALRIVDEGAVAPERMEGSWAGAMGHVQFMPSVFNRYAVDYDGDGKRDLWHSLPDALASAANFLQQLGWNGDYRWGREVLLPEAFDYRLAGLKQARPLAQWHKAGVRRVDGRPLPREDIEAALLVPAGYRGPAFLVYDNFHVIMGWNQSEYYALAVGHLADRIAGAGKLHQPPPEDLQPLNREQVLALQEALSKRGHYDEKLDGIWGPASRQALSQYQSEQQLIADGLPRPEVLKQLGIATNTQEPSD